MTFLLTGINQMLIIKHNKLIKIKENVKSPNVVIVLLYKITLI